MNKIRHVGGIYSALTLKQHIHFNYELQGENWNEPGKCSAYSQEKPCMRKRRLVIPGALQASGRHEENYEVF